MGRPGSFDFGLEGRMFGTDFDFGDSGSNHCGDNGDNRIKCTSEFSSSGLGVDV